MSGKLALYFGRLGDGGHVLHDPNGRSEREAAKGLPWQVNFMDGGLLANRKVVDRPDGRVHVAGGGRPDFWYAFVWWDRSGDHRGNSSSGFYVRGFCETVTRATFLAGIGPAFAYACEQWPQVVARQVFPLVLVDPPLPGEPRRTPKGGTPR